MALRQRFRQLVVIAVFAICLTTGGLSLAEKASGPSYQETQCSAIGQDYIQAVPGRSAQLTSVNGHLECIRSADNRFFLLLSSTGEISVQINKPNGCCLYRSNKISANGKYFLDLQENGNLAIWNGEIKEGNLQYATGSFCGKPTAKAAVYLVMQNDGNAAIYPGDRKNHDKDRPRAIWSSMHGLNCPSPNTRPKPYAPFAPSSCPGGTTQICSFPKNGLSVCNCAGRGTGF
jgi:hypothetical protein